MNTAQRRAKEIRRRFRVKLPADVARIAKAERIRIVRYPFEGRLQEMIIYRTVGIKSSIRDQRRVDELVAHALGHHYLHSGNQAFSHVDRDRALAQQMERQAWDFAFELLMPARNVEKLLRQRLGDMEMREHFQVSDEFYRMRMEAFGLQVEKARNGTARRRDDDA